MSAEGAQVMELNNRQLELLHAQQASAWIQALQDPTPEQRASFVKWLKSSPRNVRDFLFMLTVDQALDHFDAKRITNIEALLAQVNNQVVPFNSARPAIKVRFSWRSRRAMLVAASLLLASLATLVILTRAPSDWAQFATATGEQRAFELPDGSVIHLNTHSRVALHFSNQLREVRLLQGEALFRVRHDATRPFRVYTTDAVIQAVGTQFNVYERADGTEVAVIEGRVSVAAESHPRLEPVTRTVGASEEAHVAPSGLVSVRSAPDVSDVVAWRERRLVFKQETLGRIVSEFNRYSEKQIRLEGVEAQSRLFSGVFDVDDPESLAQVLTRDSSLSVRYSDNGIVISSR